MVEYNKSSFNNIISKKILKAKIKLYELLLETTVSSLGKKDVYLAYVLRGDEELMKYIKNKKRNNKDE
jgi:hypothetical protein